MSNKYNKNGLVVIHIARKLITMEVGDRLPTISEWEDEIDAARGTIQNALKELKDNDAISFIPKGHLGSFITSKNNQKLLKYSEISFLIGVMPLPYSKKYEGLATGIRSALEKNEDLTINLAFMSGAQGRISMILNNRYDFAVVSKYSAIKAIASGTNIEIVKELGEFTYLTGHGLIFRKENMSGLQDGMRMGIDRNSPDQEILTTYVAQGFEIEFVDLNYNQIMEKLSIGEIDAAVWNIDEIREKYPKFSYQEIIVDNRDDTIATIVVNHSRQEIKKIIRDLIDTSFVQEIQDKVVKKEILPVY